MVHTYKPDAIPQLVTMFLWPDFVNNPVQASWGRLGFPNPSLGQTETLSSQGLIHFLTRMYMYQLLCWGAGGTGQVYSSEWVC